MIEVEFESGSPDKPIRTIINSDGELIFPDGELEYDLAFQAMGGPETELIKLAKRWNANPIPTIVNDFDVPLVVKELLLIDAAEHVLPIFGKTASAEQYKLAYRIIKQCRITLFKNESEKAKEKLKHLIHMLARPPRSHAPTYNATISAYDAIWYAAERMSVGRVTFSNFNPACYAAGYAVVPYQNEDSDSDHSRPSPRFQQAYRQEELWEIAHFVDLMNALYDAVRDPSRSPHK